LSVECLALTSALSRRSGISTAQVVKLDELDARLDRWRRDAAQAFVDDPIRFSHVLAVRAIRDASPVEGRHVHTEHELEALTSATIGLVELLGVSLGVEREAAGLAEYCVRHALGETTTAKAFARASSEAILAMISSNIDVMRRRTAAGSPALKLEPLARAASHLPDGQTRESLESYLRPG